MQAEVRNAVRARALLRYEYCGLHEGNFTLVSHQIEHIIPRKHGGTDDLENLALACIACNLYKGANLSGIDPESRLVTPLFHPRRHHWNEHFRFYGLELVGLTPVGGSTIAVLRLNDPVHLRLRIAAE